MDIKQQALMGLYNICKPLIFDIDGDITPQEYQDKYNKIQQYMRYCCDIIEYNKKISFEEWKQDPSKELDSSIGNIDVKEFSDQLTNMFK